MLLIKYILREVFKNKVKWIFIYSNLIIALSAFSLMSVLESQLEKTFNSKSREFLASDLIIYGRNKLKNESLEKVVKFLGDNLNSQTHQEVIYSMVQFKSQNKLITKLINIGGIKKNYPLYGEVELKENKDFKELFSSTNGIFISKNLSQMYRLAESAKIKIGNINFIVKGIINTDSSRGANITLAPYAYVNLTDLKRTQLLGTSSLITYKYYFSIDNFDESMEKKIKGMIKDPSLKIKSIINAEGQMLRVFRYLSDYLKLIAFIAFLLALLGQLYLFSDYLQSKRKEIGILKSLGFSSSHIMGGYLSFLFLGGLFVFLVVLLLTSSCIPVILTEVNKVIEGSLVFDFNFEYFLIVFFMAIGGNILITYPFLKELGDKKTAHLLFWPSLKIKVKIWSYTPFIIFTVLFSIFVTKSWKLGGAFSILLGLFIFFIPLFLSLIFKLKLIEKNIDLIKGYKLRLGLKVFLRNSQKNILAITSLTGVILLVVAMYQISFNLKNELSTKDISRPSLFLFDIQPEQVGALENFLQKRQLKWLELSPMIQARMIKINNKEIKRDDKKLFRSREDEQEENFTFRTVNLSYKNEIGSSEKLIKGDWYQKNEDAEISVEYRYAKRLKLKLGDMITFDILGFKLDAKITSIRKVNWLSFIPNFFILFKPGFIEDAPKTYLSALPSMDTNQKIEVQNEITKNFPNISIVDIEETMSKIFALLKTASSIILTYGLLCLLIALALFIAIVKNHLGKSKNDIMIKRILGMNRSDILQIYFLENIISLGISFILGILLGVLGSYYIISGSFQILPVTDYLFLGKFILFISILLICFLIFTMNQILLKYSAKKID